LEIEPHKNRVCLAIFSYKNTGNGFVILTNHDQNAGGIISDFMVSVATAYDWPNFPIFKDISEISFNQRLSEFSGNYQILDSFRINVIVKNNQCFIQPQDQQEIELFPHTKNILISHSLNLMLKIDETDEKLTLTLIQEGVPHLLSKSET